jgi:L-fuculose-phosphate aldolase
MEAKNEFFIKKKVIDGSNKVYNRGLVQAGEGNISMRVPNKDEFYITPTFNQYEGLNESGLVHMKFDGTILSQGRKPSSEYKLHVAVYQTRPKVMAVIHTHSPYATMMSAARKTIPVLIEEQVIFLGGYVGISEFASAHTEEFSSNVVKALGTRNGTLMANHGVLVCGKTMEHAVKMAELVEKLAWIHYGATQIGGTHVISEKSCPMFIDEFEEKFATHTEDMANCESDKSGE